jgi:hypothetical protein
VSELIQMDAEVIWWKKMWPITETERITLNLSQWKIHIPKKRHFSGTQPVRDGKMM